MLAYLDVATGSMIMTALASGVAGIVVLLRMYKNRVLGIFSKKRREQAKLDAAELLGTTEAE